MSTTRTRRELIRAVLSSERVESQEALLVHLQDRGMPSTQPVLSRDLRALGAVKRQGAYVLLERERITPLENLQSLLRSAEPAGPHLVVVRCEPGAASAVARALEAEEPAGLLGTVAGDDTIFVAVQARAAGQSVLRRVRGLL
jgi:transcriptional regulator of arginine metabolism